MAELSPQERLQPALLDSLTDDEPDKKVEGAGKRALTKTQLRQAVLRDLAWLFNTTRLEAGEDLSSTPLVKKSALNYGLPALAGDTSASLDPTDPERAVREAILAYEPRILPSSLRVRTIVTETQPL